MTDEAEQQTLSPIRQFMKIESIRPLKQILSHNPTFEIASLPSQ